MTMGWFRSEVPPQPRNPMLVRLLEQNKAKRRALQKRAERKWERGFLERLRRKANGWVDGE